MPSESSSRSTTKSALKVWLLGDSIRGQHQPLVAQQLAGDAEVVSLAENGAFSLHTLTRFRQLAPPTVS
jgi:hypothetical protein